MKRTLIKKFPSSCISLLFILGISVNIFGQTVESPTAAWTVPAGVYSVTVHCWGGGGGGGGVKTSSGTSSDIDAGGGGGGAYSRQVLTVVPGQVYTVTLGTAGTAGSNAGSSGGAGGTTTFTGTGGTCSAAGGAGGVGLTATGQGAGGAGGNSGTGFMFAGGSGAAGSYNSSYDFGGGGGGSGGTGGAGGNGSGRTAGTAGAAGTGYAGAAGGTGAQASAGATAGAAGNAPGGGGSGAARWSGTAGAAGGAGALGRITLVYTVTPEYQAQLISVDYGSSNWCIGENRNVSITVKNTGIRTWYANGVTSPCTSTNLKVAASFKWNADPGFDSYTTAPFSNRNPIPNDVAPGDNVTITFPVRTPNGDPTGANNLSIDLIAQECLWFSPVVYTSPSIIINSVPSAPSAGSGAMIPCGLGVRIGGSLTATATGHCIPAAGSNTDCITKFVLGTINNSSAASSTAGYADYTSQNAALIPGTVYTASITSGAGSGNHGIAMWIDYNQNAVFDASELVGSTTNTITPGTTTNISFTALSTASGTYRLRVAYQYNTAGSAISSCFSATYAEAEDYLVTIQPAYAWSPAAGLSATNILNPIATPPSTQTYTLTQTINGCTSAGSSVTVTITPATVPAVPLLAVTPASACSATTATLSATGMAPGGQVATFNSTTSAINLGTPASLQITGNQTIEMWIRPNVSALRRNPFAKAYGGEGTITLEPSGYLSYYYGTAGANNTPYGGYGSAGTIANNQWTHIAVVRDLTSATKTVKFYINGVLNATHTALHATCTASALDALIGDGYVDNFDGRIDNFRIWNTARTAAEISGSMYYEVPLSNTGLAAHYAFNGDANAKIAGPNGTPTGITYTNADFYTYTWTGTSAPAASVNETQTTGSVSTNGYNSYTVVAAPSFGCYSGTTSAAVGVEIGTVTIPAVPNVSAGTPSLCAPASTNLLATGMAPGGKIATCDNSSNAMIDGTAYSGNTNNHTVEFWVNPTRTIVLHPEQNWGISGNLGAPSTEYNFATRPDHGGSTTVGTGVSVGTNGIEVVQHGDGHFPVTLSYAATVSGWTHVAVVHTGGKPTLYINGIPVKTGLSSLFPTFTSSSVGYGYGYFGGQIDNIRVWGTARTQAQIKQNIYLAVPSSTTGLANNLALDGNGTAATGANASTGSGITWSDAGYHTYTWAGGPQLPAASINETQTSGSLTAAHAGTHNYTVTAKPSAGCYTGTASSNVEVIVAAPSVAPSSISGTGTICPGNSVTLTPTGGSLSAGASYEWFTGSCAGTSVGTGNSITVAPLATITYYVRASAGSICPATACTNGGITLPSLVNTLSSTGTKTCAVKENSWVHFYDAGGYLIGAINSGGVDLGNVSMTVSAGVGGSMYACNTSSSPAFQTAYMGRIWDFSSSAYPNSSTFPSSVKIRLPYSQAELDAMNALALTTTGNSNDNGATAATMMLTKISGGSVDGNPSNDCSATIRAVQKDAANSISSAYPAIVTSGSYNDFSVNEFSEMFLHKQLGGGSPLPVTLTAFSGKCGDQGVSIYWETASEHNSDKFIVEKSRDLGSWIYVAEKTAAGSSNITQEYSITDANAPGGIVYYRLVQIDFDGQKKETDPISISCTAKEDKMLVFPNPSQGEFTVGIFSNESMSDVEMQLTDLTGKVVSSRTVTVLEGNNNILFKEENLQMGTYIIQLRVAGSPFAPVKVVIN